MSQFNAPTYEIDRPTGQCAITGKTLEPGEPYMAMLIELDEQQILEQAQSKDKKALAAAALGFKRLDVSMGAWESCKGDGLSVEHAGGLPGGLPGGERLFSYWKTVVAEPHKKKSLFVDNAVLMNLFRRLGDTTEPGKLAFRFVLGLILMRKKFLRYDNTVRKQVEDASGQSATQDFWQVTPKLDLSKGPMGKWNNDDPLEMLDPHLDEAKTQQVTEQLSDILAGEL